MKNINDVTNSERLDEDFSNFRMFGIGKQSEQEKSWEAKRKEAKKERHEHTPAERAENIAMKVPLAPVRAGFLAGLRLNVFGLSRKLYPAILSEADAKKMNYDLANREKALKALHKIENLYFKLGGRTLSVEKNIRVGFDKPIFNTKKIKKGHEEHKLSFDADVIENENFSSVAGYDDAVYVASAITPLSASAGIAGGVGAGVAGGTAVAGATAGGLSAGTIGALASAGVGLAGVVVKAVSPKKDDKANIDTSTHTPDNPFTVGTPEWKKAQDDIDKAKAEGYLQHPVVHEEDINKFVDEKGKIFGMHPFVVYGIGLVVLSVGGYLIYRKFKK